MREFRLYLKDYETVQKRLLVMFEDKGSEDGNLPALSLRQSSIDKSLYRLGHFVPFRVEVIRGRGSRDNSSSKRE